MTWLSPCSRRMLHVLMFWLVMLSPPSVEAAVDACQSYHAANRIGGKLAVMLKKHKRLCFFNDKTLLFSAKASYGRAAGKKHFQGDNRTPEGAYRLFPAHQSKRYGLFMPISYPNQADRIYAERHGRLPGSAVGIHGPQGWYAMLGTLQTLVNHSRGCIVLDQDAITKLAAYVKKTVNLIIVP